MAWIQQLGVQAPEVFLFLAVCLGTMLGRVRVRGFALGATACILLVAVVLGQFSTIVIPPLLRSVLFGIFVFTIGYRAGPEFVASLSFQTLGQVALALVMGLSGLTVILLFAFLLHFSPGTAAGIGAGSLTQTAMMGTATGALGQLGLTGERLAQEQGAIAAGYAVTYVLGYILVLLFVPLLAPKLMRVNLKEEAKKLEEELASGAPPKANNLLYKRFQARAYRVTLAAGRSVAEVEAQIGRRATIVRILRAGADIEPNAATVLEASDEVLIGGPSAVVVSADEIVGPEIEGEHVMREVDGEVIDVYVSSRRLHGRSIQDIVDNLAGEARGVFLRTLTRHGQEVPVGPVTRIYVGDVMTLVGLKKDLDRVIPQIGQAIRSADRADLVFIALGLAVGYLVGVITVHAGSLPVTLGGGGGALVAGLLFGWLRSQRPTVGAFPPAAQQVLSDIGLGGFVAAIGLANGPAAFAAIQSNGFVLVAAGMLVTLTPMVVGTLFAYHVLKMNPVIICGALAGAMTVDAAVVGACEVAESQTTVLGVAVPYAMANVVLTMLGPIIVAVTLAGRL